MRNRTGVGDLVASATKVVGIKPCRSCEKRRVKWNEKYTKYVPERLRERLGLTLTKEPA